MTDPFAPLFQPYSGGGLFLNNRFVMAPMSRYFSPGGVPDAAVAAYYRRRVEGGVGLVITEGTWISDPTAANDDRCPRLFGEAALAGWKQVVDGVHAAGGKIVCQLWHVGAQRKITDAPIAGVAPHSPSGLQGPGLKVGEPMTQRDIDHAIEAYAEAAATAKALGFDGIELHAAHGYLIDEFFWAGANLRTDGYGGDLAQRTRFGVEVVQACRARVGPGYPILLRFSQWKLPDYGARLFHKTDELGVFVDRLGQAGVDVFHCSTRRYWEPAFEGSPVTLAGWTKRLSGKPTITVGSVGLSEAMGPSVLDAKPASLDRLMALYEDQQFDLVAVGRMLIVEPRFVDRIRKEPLDALPAFSPDKIRTHLGAGGPRELV